ncbi:MAG: tetratricopeptide repeat protein [Candidatus Sericytochromatia bacterium]
MVPATDHFKVLSRRLNQRLSRPPWLRLGLVLAWISFVLLGVMVVAFCFSYIFLPVDYYLPMSLWELLMAVAGLRLLSVGLASLHDRLGQQLQASPERAAGHFRWALRMTPGNPEIYLHWGQLLRARGDMGQARELYLRARDILPGDDQPYVQLAALALGQGDWREASRLFDLAYRLRRGVAWNELPERIPEEAPLPPQNRAISTTVTKLNHDAQQLEFLLGGKYLPAHFRSLQQAYHDLLRETLGQGQGPEIRLSKRQQARIQLFYGRNVFISPVPSFPREVVNPELEARKLEQTYLNADPALVVIDDLLLPDTVEALLHFCEKSTIWHDDSRPGGYLGAYMDDGFSCDLLYQIAHELRDALPGIFNGLPLKHMWAYKYDSRREGIGIHADRAAINVNFWITPDAANLDPAHGGLLVYPAKAPEDWSFADINVDTEKALSFVAAREPIRIPYRQNRAVVFNSRLFHATDTISFKDDYLMRRINITMLFGL